MLFRDDRSKNQPLLSLEISTETRKQVLRDLQLEDFCQGPIDDTLYGQASMWVFGKVVKKRELYIKITMGAFNSSVICISSHEAERKLRYQFK